MRVARSGRSWIAVTTIVLTTLILVLVLAATSSALVPCGLDPAFGAGGVVLQHDAAGSNSALQDVALLADGSALAAGFVGFNSALARYTPCG